MNIIKTINDPISLKRVFGDSKINAQYLIGLGDDGQVYAQVVFNEQEPDPQSWMQLNANDFQLMITVVRAFEPFLSFL